MSNGGGHGFTQAHRSATQPSSASVHRRSPTITAPRSSRIWREGFQERRKSKQGQLQVFAPQYTFQRSLGLSEQKPPQGTRRWSALGASRLAPWRRVGRSSASVRLAPAAKSRSGPSAGSSSGDPYLGACQDPSSACSAHVNATLDRHDARSRKQLRMKWRRDRDGVVSRMYVGWMRGNLSLRHTQA